MKLIVALFAILPFSYSFGASITVEPFSVKFFLDNEAFIPDFKIQMACRYEKFVIGDSAKFEYKFEDVPLIIKETKLSNGLIELELINSKRRFLELTGYFKTNKECQTTTEFFLKSKIYSIGWANQFHRAIRLGIYKSSNLSENQSYDIQFYKDLFEDKELGFIYSGNLPTQTYVKFSIGKLPYESMSTYARMMVPLDPETKKPYLIKK
ncbi:MAG: hypothetical protein ACJAS4_003220 [Bacteriovoracaceae bacterium]|jgi:hypothetical protein